MHLPFGSEAYALQAVAHSDGVASGIGTIVGESEAAGTAAVAAFVAAELAEGKVRKPGVYHIHDLFELGPVLKFAAAYANLRFVR